MSTTRTVSWGEAAKQWLASVEVTCAKSTLERVRPILNAFLAWVGEREISRELVREYQRWRKVDCERAAATVNGEIGYIRLFFSWCCDEGLVEANPAQGVKVIRVRYRRRDHIADEREIARVIRELRRVHAEWCADLVELISQTGLRLSEALRLRVSDVDYLRRVLWVRSERDRETKTGAEGFVPMNTLARAVAIRRRDAAVAPANLLFSTKDGGPIDRRRAHRILKRSAGRVLVRTLNFKSLRHLFATVMAAQCTQGELAGLMRHKSPQTTQRYYVHPEAMRLPTPRLIG